MPRENPVLASGTGRDGHDCSGPSCRFLEKENPTLASRGHALFKGEGISRPLLKGEGISGHDCNGRLLEGKIAEQDHEDGSSPGPSKHAHDNHGHQHDHHSLPRPLTKPETLGKNLEEMSPERWTSDKIEVRSKLQSNIHELKLGRGPLQDDSVSESGERSRVPTDEPAKAKLHDQEYDATGSTTHEKKINSLSSPTFSSSESPTALVSRTEHDCFSGFDSLLESGEPSESPLMSRVAKLRAEDDDEEHGQGYDAADQWEILKHNIVGYHGVRGCTSRRGYEEPRRRRVPAWPTRT